MSETAQASKERSARTGSATKAPLVRLQRIDAPVPSFGIIDLVFSPASVLISSLVGYYSFAGFTNILMPEGSLGGMVIRAVLFGLLVGGFLREAKYRKSYAHYALIPAIIFLTLYIARLCENFFFSDVVIPPGPEYILPFMFAAVLCPTFMLARMRLYIKDDDVGRIMTLFCVIFILGMSLNYQSLTDTSDKRLTLDKINPISMAENASVFLIYYLIFWSKSKRILIEACIFTPILLAIIILARSRGVWIGATMAMLTYVLLLKGTKRIWALTGAGLLGLAAAYTFGSELSDIIGTRLQFTDVNSDDSSRVHYIAVVGAWDQFQENYIIGRYAVELVTGFYPHNIFLESLMSVGFVGSIPFFAHAGLAVWAAVWLIRSNESSATVAFVAVLFLEQTVICIFSGSIWGANNYWVLSCMVIVLCFHDKIGRRPARPARPFAKFGAPVRRPVNVRR